MVINNRANMVRRSLTGFPSSLRQQIRGFCTLFGQLLTTATVIPAAQRADFYARGVGGTAERQINRIPAARRLTKEAQLRAVGINHRKDWSVIWTSGITEAVNQAIKPTVSAPAKQLRLGGADDGKVLVVNRTEAAEAMVKGPLAP